MYFPIRKTLLLLASHSITNKLQFQKDHLRYNLGHLQEIFSQINVLKCTSMSFFTSCRHRHTVLNYRVHLCADGTLCVCLDVMYTSCVYASSAVYNIQCCIQCTMLYAVYNVCQSMSACTASPHLTRNRSKYIHWTPG